MGGIDDDDDYGDSKNVRKFDIQCLKWIPVPDMMEGRYGPGSLMNYKKNILFVFGGGTKSIE